MIKMSTTNTNNASDDQSLVLLFKKLDINGDLFIDQSELEKGIRELNLPNVNIDGAFDRMDYNHDHKISLDEFLVYVKKRRAELKIIFANLDKNGDGFLDVDEVSRGISEIYQKSSNASSNYPLAPQLAQQLMKRIDINHDGV